MATRDISPLELVLIDQPAVVGPATKTKPICLECLKGPLSLSTSIRCEGCHFPLCQNCHVQLSNNSRKLHTDRECNILAKCRQSKVCMLGGCQIGMQGSQLCAEPRHICKLDVATPRMAFLDLKLHVLQFATSNCTSDTPYVA